MEYIFLAESGAICSLGSSNFYAEVPQSYSSIQFDDNTIFYIESGDFLYFAMELMQGEKVKCLEL